MSDSIDILERLRAPHGYFGRTMRCQAADEIARLRARVGEHEDELRVAVFVQKETTARIAELEKDREKADRISKEKAEYFRHILRLEAALKPFADLDAPSYFQDMSMVVFALKVSDIRAARAALEGKDD